jgi:hypothetical protein
MPWPSKDPADYQGRGMPAYLLGRGSVSPWWLRLGAYLATFLVVLVPVVLLSAADAWLTALFANLAGQLAQWAADVVWRRRHPTPPAGGDGG